MQTIILWAIIIVAAVLANFAFRQANRERRGLKFRNKPDFTPMKLDEEKINDYSKN